MAPRGSGDGAVRGLALDLRQHLGPRPDIRPTPQEGPALALGHPAPHAELGAVVEGIGEALGPDRAPLAHDLGGPLGLALDEEGVGIPVRAASPSGPVGHPVAITWCDLGCSAHVHLCSAGPSDAPSDCRLERVSG